MTTALLSGAAQNPSTSAPAANPPSDVAAAPTQTQPVSKTRLVLFRLAAILLAPVIVAVLPIALIVFALGGFLIKGFWTPITKFPQVMWSGCPRRIGNLGQAQADPALTTAAADTLDGQPPPASPVIPESVKPPVRSNLDDAIKRNTEMRSVALAAFNAHESKSTTEVLAVKLRKESAYGNVRICLFGYAPRDPGPCQTTEAIVLPYTDGSLNDGQHINRAVHFVRQVTPDNSIVIVNQPAGIAANTRKSDKNTAIEFAKFAMNAIESTRPHTVVVVLPKDIADGEYVKEFVENIIIGAAQICHAGAGATPADKPTLHVAISYESIADSKPFFRDFPKAKAGIDEAVAKVKNGGKFFTGIGNLEKYIDFTP